MASNKQQMAIQLYMENRGMSVGEAMRQAGYSEASAKNPKNLTSSAAWQEMMDKYLPDIELVAVHREQLASKKLDSEVFPLGLDELVIKSLLEEVGCTIRHREIVPEGKNAGIHVWFWAPDQAARSRALDLAYKLKGKMTQKVEHSGAVDGLFGTDALTITVVDAEHNVQP